MRTLGKNCDRILVLALAFGLTGALSGCGDAGGQKTEFKPIESNILKKLGTASQSQGDEAKARALAAKGTGGAARGKVFAGVKKD
jgi:hypothetical protein